MKAESDAKQANGAGAAERAAGAGAESKDAAEAKRAKGEQTRTLILETALRLFQERGYDKTTMRAIAQEAGVSVGNAYYYFDSKEHLIQGFYDRIAAEHAAAMPAVLEHETELAARIRGMLLTWLDLAAPYHEFAAQFFKNAADPASPLSPFSPESGPARDQAVELCRQVLEGTKSSAVPEIRELLPQLLWMHQMGLVLYWVFDQTEDSERSRRLVERSSPVVARAIELSRYRILRPLVREVGDVLYEFVLPAAAGAAVRKGS